MSWCWGNRDRGKCRREGRPGGEQLACGTARPYVFPTTAFSTLHSVDSIGPPANPPCFVFAPSVLPHAWQEAGNLGLLPVEPSFVGMIPDIDSMSQRTSSMLKSLSRNSETRGTQ